MKFVPTRARLCSVRVPISPRLLTNIQKPKGWGPRDVGLGENRGGGWNRCPYPSCLDTHFVQHRAHGRDADAPPELCRTVPVHGGLDGEHGRHDVSYRGPDAPDVPA